MSPDFDSLDKLFSASEEIHGRYDSGISPNVDAQMRALVEERTTELLNNGLLSRYIAHINRYERNVKPEHGFGERLYAEYLCYAAASGKVRATWYDEKQTPVDWRVCAGVAQMIRLATVYLWAAEMENVADAAPLPPHTISRSVLPFPLIFWSREVEFLDRTHTHANNWIAVIHNPKGMLVVGDSMRLTGTKPGEVDSGELVFGKIPYQKLWPTDVEGDEQSKRSVELILKRCAFLNSPYVVTERQRLPRHFRRHAKHFNIDPDESEDEMHVVKLRRLHVKKPASGERREIDWKHKWWVSAHYRAQWYPSEQAHKVIWIAPYLKGPDDAPILEKLYSVVR